MKSVLLEPKLRITLFDCGHNEILTQHAIYDREKNVVFTKIVLPQDRSVHTIVLSTFDDELLEWVDMISYDKEHTDFEGGIERKIKFKIPSKIDVTPYLTEPPKESKTLVAATTGLVFDKTL